jgi:hypothetical protein
LCDNLLKHIERVRVTIVVEEKANEILRILAKNRQGLEYDQLLLIRAVRIGSDVNQNVIDVESDFSFETRLEMHKQQDEDACAQAM